MIKVCLTLLSILFLCRPATCQQLYPEVIFQTGLSSAVPSQFNFSPSGKFLFGVTDAGEYVIWDTKSGRQIKRITRIVTGYPNLFYPVQSAISNDETRMLIPDYPKGNYILYDLIANRPLHFFEHSGSTGEYTHALFSGDRSRILLISQQPGENHPCTFHLFTGDGKLIRSATLDLPVKVFENKLLLQLLIGRMQKLLKSAAYLVNIVADSCMDHLYFSLLNGKVYALDISDKSTYYMNGNFQEITGLGKESGSTALSLYKDKLLIRVEGIKDRVDSVSLISSDTTYVADLRQLRIEKKVPSAYLAFTLKHRSNVFTTNPITTSQSLNTYLRYNRTGPFDAEIIGRDVLTDREVFRYKKGTPHNFNTNSSYDAGKLNGGYVVAISADQQLMAECSRDIVIHQLEKKKIKTVINAARGQLKLTAPLFLDSTRLLIPKAYNDGFLLSLKTGVAEQLRQEIDYQDTLDNGLFIQYSYHNTAQIGIQTSSLLDQKKQFVMTSIAPVHQRSKSLPFKEITVWDSKTLIKKASYIFQDSLYTWFINGVSGYPKRFLVNHKLVNFEKPGAPVLTALYIKKKRDTFYAVNPVYFPLKGKIISITGTRSKPGHPYLLFGVWDINGKMLKYYTYKRENSKLEYKNLIYEAQLSPDSTKLLFGLYDGTAGIFDLETMKVTSTYEHGTGFKNDAMKLYSHINITAACFIDNSHFVTCGDDMAIRLWTIGKSTAERVLNSNPVYLLSLSISPDKKYLIGISIDKTLHFINIASGISDASFIVSSPNAYTLVNSDGFYISNKKAVNDLSFYYNGKAYEFSQFDLSLHRPDQVMKTLGYATPQAIQEMYMAWERRIRGLNYTPAFFKASPIYSAPEIEIRDLPELLADRSLVSVSFKVAATDPLHSITRLMITVNGVSIYGSGGLRIKPKLNKITLIPVTVPLSYGRNQIAVSVLNSSGTESLQQVFTAFRSGSARPPDLHIIAIGCARFADSRINLKYPVKDAREIIRLFKTRSAFYGKITIDTLFDQQVSAAKIMSLKSKLLLSRPDDFVILYYAGHGTIVNQQYFLSTYYTHMENPALQSISYEKVEGLLDSIPARNKLMLIDACYSGEADKDANNKTTGIPNAPNAAQQRKTFELMQALFSDLRKSNGASVIGSSGPSELALETDVLQNGVFTYFLKNALQNKAADLNKNGEITVSELADYLKEQVSVYTEKEQRPTLRNQNIFDDLVVWK